MHTCNKPVILDYCGGLTTLYRINSTENWDYIKEDWKCRKRFHAKIIRSVFTST